MRILLSSNAQNLAAALAAFSSTATVEAEYGETVVEGSVLTLAHHGLRSANPAPCLASNGVAGDPEKVEAVGLSHLDLDSLGGVLAVLGRKPEPGGFWELAAHVDVHGPHKLSETGATEENVRRLYAYWAWSQAHRVMPSRDGSVTDVAEQVQAAEQALRQIFAELDGLLEAGDAFRLAEDALNKRSFIQMEGEVIVRVAEVFTNNLYFFPDGEMAKAVAAFNTVTGGITVSLADPIPGVSALEIVQGLWGTEAGGRAGIAGSPRGQRMTLADLQAAFVAVQAAIAAAD